MDYGLSLPQGAGFDLAHDVTAVAREAEKAGYRSLWVYQRALFPLAPSDGMNGVPGLPWIDFYRECADPLTVLTLAATATETVRLGTGVLIAPLYPALVLARAFATLDRASSGRVVAGFGGGWSSDEFRAAGADFATRGRVLEETVDACRAFWGTDPVTYRDSRAEVADSLVAPKPAGAIPVLLGGGKSARAVDRIARKADGWIPSGLPAPVIRETWLRIRELAAGYGRDAAALRLVVRAPVVLTPAAAPEGRRPFQGSLDQIVDDVAELSVADEVILDVLPSARDGQELAARAHEVLDAVRAAGL